MAEWYEQAGNPGFPLVESPFFHQLIEGAGLSPAERAVAEHLHRHGYAIVQFPEPALDQLAGEIRATLLPRFDHAAFIATGRNDRFLDAWRDVPAVRRIAANAAIRTLLSRVYGRRAIPFQTLNFMVGTEQHLHTDAVHFHCVPERFMCGVWLALEDVDADNGPILYAPGSHSLPVYTHDQLGVESPGGQAAYEGFWRSLVKAKGLALQEFHARKGEVLIWAANLLHGGAPQVARTRTRLSQVTHYYFEGCGYYMPHSTDWFLGRVARKELVDIATGEVVPTIYCGRPVGPGGAPVSPAGQAAFPALPPGWDGAAYLQANPDVAAAGVDPAEHWLRHGRFEGRLLRPA